MNGPAISRDDLRRQVIAQIADVMAQAESGLDGMDLARKRFPGTPTSVLISAYAELRARREEAWWQDIERSINEETVRKALEAQPAGRVR